MLYTWAQNKKLLNWPSAFWQTSVNDEWIRQGKYIFGVLSFKTRYNYFLFKYAQSNAVVYILEIKNIFKDFIWRKYSNIEQNQTFNFNKQNYYFRINTAFISIRNLPSFWSAVVKEILLIFWQTIPSLHLTIALTYLTSLTWGQGGIVQIFEMCFVWKIIVHFIMVSYPIEFQEYCKTFIGAFLWPDVALCSSFSQRFSIGLRSGLLAGKSITLIISDKTILVWGHYPSDIFR